MSANALRTAAALLAWSAALAGAYEPRDYEKEIYGRDAEDPLHASDTAKHLCQDAARVELGLWLIAQSLARHPDDAFLYEARAECHSKQGKKAQARRDLEQAIASQEELVTKLPDYMFSLEHLVGLYEKAGKCDKALQIYARMELINNADPADDEHARGHKRDFARRIKEGRERCAPKRKG